MQDFYKIIVSYEEVTSNSKEGYLTQISYLLESSIPPCPLSASQLRSGVLAARLSHLESLCTSDQVFLLRLAQS